jgi:hypothetical protein
LQLLGRLAQKVGLRATYVLVDRIDETQETGKTPRAAYQMIAPLMHELKILESTGFAYKFFVPDFVSPFYQADGGRSDRVTNYHTQWWNEELREMMRRRLLAHSDGKIDSLDALLDAEAGERGALVQLTIWFAQKSPRDLVRIWRGALDEQLRLDSTATLISREALFGGIDRFCSDKAEEIATASVLRELRRLSRVDFTISELASDVLRVTTQAARARIQGWENKGVVTQIGSVPVEHGRPQYHFGIVDARVARSALPDVRLDQFVATKARICPDCESWVLRDWDAAESAHEELCAECGIPLEALTG